MNNEAQAILEILDEMKDLREQINVLSYERQTEHTRKEINYLTKQVSLLKLRYDMITQLVAYGSGIRGK